MARKAGKAYPVSTVRTWRTLEASVNLSPFAFPLRLAIQTAIDDGERMTGHRFCSEHLSRVTQKNHCPECGECDTITGYEVGDSVVTLTDNEADELIPLDDGTARFTAYADPDDFDPTLFDATYAVWWADDAAAPGFALFARAMEASGRYLVGTLMLGRTERVFLLRYSEAAGTIVANTLKHDARIRWGHLSATREALERIEVTDEQVEAANAALSTLAASFDPAEVEDTYSVNLRAAVEAKAAGATPAAKPAKQEAAIPDLMDALRASVDAAKANPKPAAKLGKRGLHSPRLDNPSKPKATKKTPKIAA